MTLLLTALSTDIVLVRFAFRMYFNKLAQPAFAERTALFDGQVL